MLEYLRLRAGDAGFKDGDATHVDQPVVAAPEDQRRRPHLAEPVVERMVAHLRRDHPEDAVELVAIFERVAVEGGLEPRRDMRRLDRKRVGWGKSVAVRVDVGGRRIIKKKKKKRE